MALVPPWADPVDADLSNSIEPEDESVESDDTPRILPIAPPARFREARRCLGVFTTSGSVHDLRRALEHYISSGYGGGRLMTRRLGATVPTAGRLNSILASGTRPDGTSIIDEHLASGTNVHIVLDAIVDAARPGDGTQDTESARNAVRESLVALLARFPNADLLSLTNFQREFVIERYVALDIFGRFCLDMRATIMEKAEDAATGLIRIKQVRDYINEHVFAAFRRLRDQSRTVSSSSVTELTRQALRETFSIFEEYLV